jgi:small subunit ribosomal protein S1
VLEIGQKVRVKVLDVDRDRQRISLGLKQTQTDPWQRVIDETQQGDVVSGRITKVVTFGAFAEIVSGVEGLIHISELAEHHVENPREVVQQGEEVKVKIIEIDPDRRRLSLSLRRVEAGDPVKTIDLGTPGERQEADVPELGLSEEVFADQPQAADEESEPVADEPEAAVEEPEAVADATEAEAADEPEAEAGGGEPDAEVSAPDPGDGTADEG